MLNPQTDVQVAEGSFPLQHRFEPGTPVTEFVNWYQASEPALRQDLLRTGALLFEGIAIGSVADFEALTGAISTKFRNYVDGSYPRRRLSSHVYISTEYDANFQITMHNELSYSTKWPERLYLGCIIPPREGGQTPLADSRRVLRYMPPDLLAEFEAKGVKYVRNLHAGEGLGPSWQETFETDDPRVVERHCNEIDIAYQWQKGGGVKLIHVRPATRVHPVTGEKVWFNQVDQYHPSHLRADIYETLLLLAGGREEDLPLYASFGDGTPLTVEIIKAVQQAIDQCVFLRPWQQGDFVVLDNMLVCHGRMPYRGDRQIVVSMA
jgi:hypothetical protein